MQRPMPASSQDRTGTFTEHRPSDGLSDILRGVVSASPALSCIRPFAEQFVLIGYMRISKADGSQTLDLQRDALLAAGVEPGHLYGGATSDRDSHRYQCSEPDVGLWAPGVRPHRMTRNTDRAQCVYTADPCNTVASRPN